MPVGTFLKVYFCGTKKKKKPEKQFFFPYHKVPSLKICQYMEILLMVVKI